MPNLEVKLEMFNHVVRYCEKGYPSAKNSILGYTFIDVALLTLAVTRASKLNDLSHR
jgi:hypothetical protein